MKEDRKSLRLKADLKCGIRTSFKLTPKAQRKKRLVINTKGKMYFRSVSRADCGAKFPPCCRSSLQRLTEQPLVIRGILACFLRHSGRGERPEPGLLVASLLGMTLGTSRQRAVEMDVAAVDENVLAGDVAGLRRNQEQHHGRDFLGLRHALAERNFRNDVLELLFGIGKRAEPPLVERSHDFGGNERVDAHAVGKQFAGPVAHEGEDRTFRGSVAGG